MRLSLTLVVLSLCASPAQASDPLTLDPQSPWYLFDSEPGWHFDLGLGLELEPNYAGADDSTSEVAAFAQAVYHSEKGHRYFLGLGEVGLNYSISPNTQIQAFLEYEEGREVDDDELLIGLEPIDSTFEGQFTLARRFGNKTVFATLQPDVAGDANKGLVWFIGASRDWMSADETWRFGTRLDLSGANAEYMQTEFGISAVEAARTRFDEYTPGSGLKSATLGLSAEYFINNRLSVLSTMEVERYLDKASASPLIQDVGSDTTVEASVLLRWRF
ncbi:MAG: MipA/OmpV family protein [Pseudomonadota bacterium]